MIIQAKTRKKEFTAFNTTKAKNFKPLNSPQAWLALLELSKRLLHPLPPETDSL